MDMEDFFVWYLLFGDDELSQEDGSSPSGGGSGCLTAGCFVVCLIVALFWGLS